MLDPYKVVDAPWLEPSPEAEDAWKKTVHLVDITQPAPPKRLVRKYDPDQPRDPGGRWTSGGGVPGGGTPEGLAENKASYARAVERGQRKEAAEAIGVVTAHPIQGRDFKYAGWERAYAGYPPDQAQALQTTEAAIMDLSKEHFTAVDATGTVVSDHDGSDTRVEIPDEEHHAIQDAVGTHNHPTGNGGLSSTDMKSAVNIDMEAVRVTHISRDTLGGPAIARYTELRRGEDGWPTVEQMDTAIKAAMESVTIKHSFAALGALSGSQKDQEEAQLISNLTYWPDVNERTVKYLAEGKITPPEYIDMGSVPDFQPVEPGKVPILTTGDL